MSDKKQIIFISCGQWSNDEKNLGKKICEIVRELTPFEPYFAENQSTFEGLTQNILGALNQCAGFIGIMHHRGKVETPSGLLIRGSVWIEQEIALAAFIQAILSRKLHVRLYIQKGTAREGIRDKLLLNPVQFETSDEILEDLKLELQNWQEVQTPNLIGLRLDMELGYEKEKITGERHDYKFVVKLKNTGSVKPKEWRVDIHFPYAFLEPSTIFVLEKRGLRTPTHALFRVTQRERPQEDLYPGDTVMVMTIPYFVDYRGFHIIGEGNPAKTAVKATVYADGMHPRTLEKSIAEFQIF